VSLESTGLVKSLVTNTTLEFPSHMDQRMSVEAAAPLESLTTEITGVWPLARVGTHMNIQIANFKTTLAADVTNICLFIGFIGVRSTHMVLKTATCRKSFMTNVTFRWSFITMGTHVRLQGTQVCKLLEAHVASV